MLYFQSTKKLSITTISLWFYPQVFLKSQKYKQWNAAFDAGYAAALGKSIIVLHDPVLTHALKEVDAAALAITQSPEEVVDIMKYVINGELPN